VTPSEAGILIGIDLGTTACRAIVFDRDLRQLSASSRPLALTTRSGTEIEQDAEEWWRAARETVREAVRTSGCDARSVKGVGISSQGIAFVPVDGAGSPLRAAFSWLDTRASEQRRRILERFPESLLFSITGKRCSEAYVLAKILWLREKDPRTWDKTRRILMPMDFILSRLTGDYLTDHSMASGTMYYDITRQEWSSRILAAFDLDTAKLPELRWGGTDAGGLRAEAADALGLPRGVVVSVGGQDQKVAALGAGIDLERCTISLGTAMAITQKCDRPVIDPEMRMPCFSDLFPGRWVIEGSAACCSVLDWAKQAFFPDIGWDELNRVVEESRAQPGAPCFLPFFSGAAAPFFDTEARGMLAGLDHSTTPAQIIRSFYEGIGFLIRANIDVMESISRPPRGLRIFGGGAKSDTWCRIIADAVQRPVSALATTESASVGAAILAGMASGVFESAEDAFAHLEVRTEYEPRPGRASEYDEKYARFCELTFRLLDGQAPRPLPRAPGRGGDGQGAPE
jgi:xylulokinase